VGVVDEAVEDGIGKSGVADDGMPVVEGELAGDEGGPPSVAILEKFEHIVALGIGERGEAEVVEDKELGLGETVQELGVGAVGPGEGEFAEEP
jgi:hypothetical protein